MSILSCQSTTEFEACNHLERSPNSVSCKAVLDSDRITGMPVTQHEVEFVKKENDRAAQHLASVDPALSQAIKARAVDLTPKNVPVRVNYHGKNLGIHTDGSLVNFQADGKMEVLIPGTLVPKDARIMAYRFSPDQTKIAFSYSKFGSDWQSWQIFDRPTNQILTADGEFIFKNLGGPVVAWTPDSKAILYASDLSIVDDFHGKRNPQVKLHKLGTNSNTDLVVFSHNEEAVSSRWSSLAIANEKFLVMRTQGAATVPIAAFVVDIKEKTIKPAVKSFKFIGNSPGNTIVGYRDGIAYFRTAQAGNNFGILAVNVNAADPIKASRVLIPNDNKSSLYQASLVGNKIVTQNINRDLTVEFRMYDLEGRLVARLIPSQFGLSDFGHPSLPLLEADSTSTTAFLTYSTLETPPVTFQVDIQNNEFIKLKNSAEIPFDALKVTRKLVTYKSHDGADIQMFVYQRADMANKPAPFVYLYSYGFIGVPNLPQWNRKFQLALDLGAIVALPAIRGGGEFGASHQLQGTKKRWNTLKDLVYASRWLKQNYSVDQNRVVAVGRSFGGMTGAAHYVHHQNEFSLISSIVPVTDWGKHFDGSGWWMADDFNLSRNAEGKATYQAFEELKRRNEGWNPIRHLGKIKNKSSLIPMIMFSGQFDTNTTPHQTFNFVESVRNHDPNAPLYMLQHPNVGHGGRAELVDEMLFIAKEFGLTSFTPLK